MLDVRWGSIARLVLPAALLLAACAVPGCAVGAPSADDAAVRQALAEQEIARLQVRYGQATDLITRENTDSSRTRAVYRRLFTERAEIGLQDQKHVVGPDAWLAFVEVSQAALQGSQHLIGSLVVEVVELPDPRGAGGRATMTSYLTATQVAPGGAIARIIGTYRAQAVHTPGIGWQLSRMTLSLLAVDRAP
ncbi:MAG: nuclear transport factor 2 family protein [Pseudomonadales bacterium]